MSSRRPVPLASIPGVRIGAALLLGLMIVIPFATTSVLPLLDYPNHLARMGIIAAHGSNPALNAMYALHWAFYPDLAMDLIVPALALVMPVQMAGGIFVALTVLLFVSGTVGLHRALFRSRSLWPLIGALTAYNFVLTNGFLNYLFGIGAALWGAALWIRLADRRLALRAGFALLAGAVCLVSHIFAFAFLALLCGSIELLHWWRSTRQFGRPMLPWRSAVVLAATILPPFLAYRLWGPSNTYSNPDQGRLFLAQLTQTGLLAEPKMRLLWLVGVVSSPALSIDVISAALLVAIPGMALWRRSLAFAPEPLLAAVFVLVGFLMLPSTAIDNGMMYQRLALPLVLLCIAGVQPVLPARIGIVAAAAVLGMLVVHCLGAAIVWHGQDAVLQDMRAVTRGIAPCSRVLATRDGNDAWKVEPDEPAVARIFYNGVAYNNLPALLTLERHAFWPMVFAEAGKQPLAVRAPFRALQQDDGYLPLTKQLGMRPQDNAEVRGSNGWPAQLRDWRHRYDDLLILNQHQPERDLPAGLQLQAERGFAALYRIDTGPHLGCGAR